MASSGDYFSELLITEYTHKGTKRKESILSGRSFRIYLLYVAVFAIGFLFLTRLFYLQIVEGNKNRLLSDSNRTRTIVIHAPRGIFFDRNNTPLVYNVPGFRKTENDKTILLSQKEALSSLAKKEKNISIDALRNYPYKESFAHVLGYIGQISKEDLERVEFSTYNGGDLVGKTGLERVLEKTLKGEEGKRLIEINSMGEEVRILGETDPLPGEDIVLTLDAKLQDASYKAFGDVKKGAVIASTPQGEILALVSKPSFDPNLFTMGQGYKTATDSAYQKSSEVLLDGENQPLLDRAVSGTYPPGSTFKLITAASGLENGIIDDSYTVEDTGIVRIGDFSFANWYYTQYGGKDGIVDVVKGIARSNDIFFYKLAEKIGVNKLSDMARKFGLGKKTGIELLGEEAGIVPDPKWKEEEIGEQWYLGDTYHYGIGQGFLLTTPLQVNQWTQVIANGGSLYQPTLLKSDKRKAIREKFLNEKTIALVREGMIESCSPGGVAWPLFNFKVKNAKLKVDGKNILEAPVSTSSASSSAQLAKDERIVTVACKTGTAQHGGEKTLPHAWITLFAPAYDPQIVVTVLAESAGEGSNIAAPIAKKILEEWFTR